jgi:hypothetical protein
MRSRLRAHALEWHVAPPAHIDSRHRAGFLELQRRCNNELGRHQALTHNAWLDRLEQEGAPALEALFGSLSQLAHFLRHLAQAREQHARHLGQDMRADSEFGTAVVICFDEEGVPWCPPLPGMGMGDPYVMSERLNAWWSAWGHNVPASLLEDNLQRPATATEQLCRLVTDAYNASDAGLSLGTMLALENGISTDFWQRLGRGLRRCCETLGLKFPDAGFFPVAETHARLQARHVLYLVEAASVQDRLDEEVFFQAGLAALEHLDRFWQAQSRQLGSISH